MNELEEIMNGKHEIKHLKIDNDTLTFNTELNNYDWNLTPRDIEMIIYTLQEDKNNLQSKIDKAIELNGNIRKKLLTCPSYEKDEVEDLLFNQLDILKEDK